MNLISKLRSIFEDLRINRILMFILITGSVAYGLGGTWLNVVLAGLIGATLSGAASTWTILPITRKTVHLGR